MKKKHLHGSKKDVKIFSTDLFVTFLEITANDHSSYGLCIRTLLISSFLMIPILKNFPEIAKNKYPSIFKSTIANYSHPYGF